MKTLLLLLGVAALPLQASERPPMWPEASTGHAEFETTAGYHHGGWATVVKTSGGTQAYILSVRHLLGPEGGFGRQIEAQDVPAFVRSIRIDSFTGGQNGYFVNGLPIASAGTDTRKTPLADLAIFRVHNSLPLDRAVPLANQGPAVGETVWLVTKGTNVVEATVPATVVTASTGGWLTVRLAGRLRENASGAPVLNSAGELVGVCSHGGKPSDVLALIPASAIATVLPSSP